MKKHFLHVTTGVMIALALFIVAALQSSIEKKSKDRDRAEIKAEVAEGVSVQAVEEVVTLRRALEMKEGQRKHTQALVDFIIAHGGRCVVVVADADGAICHVEGDAGLIRWSRAALLSAHINDTRPAVNRREHSRAVERRASEGKSGEIFTFERETALSESGDEFLLNGVMLWHEDRAKFVGIFAPPLE